MLNESSLSENDDSTTTDTLHQHHHIQVVCRFRPLNEMERDHDLEGSVITIADDNNCIFKVNIHNLKLINIFRN